MILVTSCVAGSTKMVESGGVGWARGSGVVGGKENTAGLDFLKCSQCFPDLWSVFGRVLVEVTMCR